MTEQDIAGYMEASQPENPTKKTAAEVIIPRIEAVVTPYRKILHADAEDLELRDLGDLARERLEQQERELDTLMRLMDAFLTHPETFRLSDQRHKALGNRNTFTARFAPKDEPLPIGPEHPQDQLNFHANIGGAESVIETLSAVGLGRDPHHALQRFLRDSSNQMIQFNTLGVYLDPISEDARINPHAGVTFRLSSGEKEARAVGITHIGSQAHYHDVPAGNIPKPLFVGLLREVVRLSGYRQP